MNKIKISSILGLINYTACSNDFLDQYDLVIGSNAYYYECLDVSIKHGLVLMHEDESKCVNVPISLNSYLTLKKQCDMKPIEVCTSHSIMSVLSNQFDINVILGFVKDAHDDYFESYIVYEKDGKFICANMPISDIFGIKGNTKFPVFLNKKIIEKRSVSYEEIIQNIDMGVWRLYH